MIRGVSAEPVTSWAPSPWFLTTAPQAQEAVVDRSRVIERIAASVATRRLTAIAAPAGFGKTVAASEWSRRHDGPVAWLSLTRFDRDPARLLRGMLSALHVVAAQWGLDGGAMTVCDLDDAEAGYATIVRAVEGGVRPVALVIDDAHLAGDALGEGALGALIAHGPPALRLVLSGQTLSGVPLDRLIVSGAAESIGTAELSFTTAEVSAAAEAMRRPLADDEAAAIHATSGGWPAAVRLGLMAGSPAGNAAGSQRPAALAASAADPSGRLTDYVADAILAALDPDLADFVLAATTCSRVDARLASALSARSDSAELLEECVRRGLFLDRFSDRTGTTIYRWHAVFAEQCRAIQHRSDPVEAMHLHRVAAEQLAAAFPLEAVVHALRANDPRLGADTITSRWVGLVIESHAGALERQCAALPAPWADDPEILAIRACCRDTLGDRAGATLLFVRSTTQRDTDGAPSVRLRLTTALTQLFVADDHAALAAAADEVGALLQDAGAISPSTYACGLFLLGWTELRLRRDPSRAVALLRSAVRECELADHATVASRASSNLAFALAFGGALNAARGAWRHGVRRRADERTWIYDGGIEAMTIGFVDYWQDDLVAAEAALRSAAEGAVNRTSYAALARVFLTFVACASRDPRKQATAETELRGVSDAEAHGVPWPTYKLLARAKLAEARGRNDLALALARQITGVRHVPVTTVMLAELHRRTGEPDAASTLLRTLAPQEQTSYVRASALLTSALLNRAAARADTAHRLLEESLATAVPESIARPYADPDPDLADLLRDHAAWGTRHESFVAARIARLDAATRERHAPGTPLSPREREILGLLRTTMTTAEIAAALHLSLNTVKTHQRAIYRKLGVRNRRDAVKTRH